MGVAINCKIHQQNNKKCVLAMSFCLQTRLNRLPYPPHLIDWKILYNRPKKWAEQIKDHLVNVKFFRVLLVTNFTHSFEVAGISGNR